MKTSAAIRKEFLDFFISKEHQIVPSSSIVIKNDATLLFTNAGMNQFKDYFLGNKIAPFSRIADTQKCLRVSGKHNDLEEVGVDTYHHTMFEMLGNWSFGDYFKKEAIAWSWELLTEVYQIPKDRLYVTIFEGDAQESLPKDDEAFTEWSKWVSEDRIIPGNKKDNFWEMGETGPCGPCTEIHVDCRPDNERQQLDGQRFVNKDHPQVIEIWNNVFIQFNRLKDGSLESLPSKHVDTGMGLERLVRVLQQKQSNYDTDVFTGTIGLTEDISGKKYARSDSRQDVAFRVIADHIRAIAFTIADGQLPSNTGAGYVIRRILRRAVRYCYSYLDHKQPLLFKLVPLLAAQFEQVFPELSRQSDFVQKVIHEEEEAFLRTLGVGLQKFSVYISKNQGITVETDENSPFSTDALIQLQSKNEVESQKTISGKFAFELNDTFGFPIDLTNLMAKEIGWIVDMKAFELEMQQQKSRSRAAGATDTEDWVILIEQGSTDFVGYVKLETSTSIVRYRKVNAKGKQAFHLVLSTTPFYAESGGQVGDSGKLVIGDEQLIITDTRKENDLIIHYTDELPADLSAPGLATVERVKRKAIALHHTATHLLHAALRQVLGNHVAQKGSLVSDAHLRFDFSHFAKLKDDEILQVEKLVNQKIRENIPVVIKQMPKDEALSLGAMALFGEKYGNDVRVVIIDPGYSVELCGGTHAGATGELGYFKIKQESAVAAGVRRIEALSGMAAESFVSEQLLQVQAASDLLKNPKNLIKSIEDLLRENNELRKKSEKQDAGILIEIKKQLLQKMETITGIHFIGERVEVSNADTLKKLCFELKAQLSNFLVVLVANIDGKACVAVCLDDTLADNKNLQATTIIKQHIAPLIKGGGGGQRTLATAGGQETANLQQVIEKVKSLIA
ncbi:MAG: alanine--tRNA ligase [Chitinophagaceae bacterium]